MKPRALELARIIRALRGDVVSWPEDTDWRRVAEAARHHGVLVLLDRRLNNPVVRDAAHSLTKDALLRVHQLRGLLDVLQGEGVTVLPIKGPVLAATAYGDVALRGVSGDLDLVVRSTEFARTLELLIGKGYWRHEPGDEYDLWEDEAHLYPPGAGTMVEVHTELLGNPYTVPVDLEAVLARGHERSLFGTSVRVPAAEDLLLYLCLHGARHIFRRLLWVADLDAVIRSTPDLDWDVLFARAASIDARRRVVLALYLTHRLLGTPIPGSERLFRSLRLPFLERVVLDRMADTADGLFIPGFLNRFLAEFGARETSRQRITYLWRQLEPNSRDRAWLALPPRLRWLLWLARPFRLLARLGTSGDKHDH